MDIVLADIGLWHLLRRGANGCNDYYILRKCYRDIIKKVTNLS